MPDADTNRILHQVWQRNLPLLRDRIATLESAVVQAEVDLLSSAQRGQAADLAHKLAGSLGMFGYMAGTEIARELENLLTASAPVDAAHFRALTRRLHAALPL